MQTKILKSEIILPETVSHRKIPVNFKKEDAPFFEREFSKIIPATVNYEFEAATVTADGIILNGLKPFIGSLHAQSALKWLGSLYGTLTYIFKKKALLEDGRYIAAINYWSEGYYHWMAEIIPRLFCIKNLLQDSILLVPETWNSFYSRKTMIKCFMEKGQPFTKNGFHFHSLAPFQIKGIQTIPYDNYFCIKNLIIPSYTAPTGNYNDAVMQGIRDLYHGFFSLKFNKGLKIYLSRAKAERRKIINENDLIAFLNKYGFTTLCFEDFTFEEQVSISYNAKYMIGLHGANLTNMLFMKPESYVLEIRPENDIHNLCYYSLASSLNINYLYYFGKKNRKDASAQDSDLIIDLEGLKVELEKIL